MPALLTAAMPVKVELHVPPPGPPGSLSVIVAPPAHTVVVPEMADGVTGSGLIVTTFMAAILPQLLVSV